MRLLRYFLLFTFPFHDAMNLHHLSCSLQCKTDFMVYGDFDNPNTIVPPYFNPFLVLSLILLVKREKLRDCITKRKELNKYSTKLCLDIIIIFQIKLCTCFRCLLTLKNTMQNHGYIYFTKVSLIN